MKILVVEDNKKLSSFLQRAFQEEGYEAVVVEDGAAALQQCDEGDYDLVVLDWMLPEVDGIQVCQRLRQRGDNIPILMLTARHEVSDRITGLDAGADDFLPKPFDLGELLARVRALGRRSPGHDSALRVGPLYIDRLEHQVTLDGEPLDLPPREFALLTYLAREAGRVVSRSELLREVWDITVDPGSNVVDAHVKKLRERLGVHAVMLQTVRGVGYRLQIESAPEL